MFPLVKIRKLLIHGTNIPTQFFAAHKCCVSTTFLVTLSFIRIK